MKQGMSEEGNMVNISKEAGTMGHVHGSFCLVALWKGKVRT